jgi:sugar phosphate isomerase/epimerase
MMNNISFMSANYVARPVDYEMKDWGHGDKATNEYFQPLETYQPRLEELFSDIQQIGFTAIDLWLSHLNYSWATEGHIAIAKDLVDQYGFEVISVTGWLGSTPEEFERCCQIAEHFDVHLLGGMTSMLERDRTFVLQKLEQYDLALGIENHPEKSAQEILDKIGDGGGGRIGATVDTGWFATQGADVVAEIRFLGDHIFHVHLKDVRESGTHHTCRYGEGVVPLKECVETLVEMGYKRAFSVEHEPETFDPTEDCRVNLELLRRWLNELK